MKRYSKILLCAVLSTAFSFFSVLSVFAQDYTKYYVDYNPDMYDDMNITLLYSADTGDMRFDYSAADGTLYKYEDMYYFQLVPTDFYDAIYSQPGENGGLYYVEINIPFIDSFGNTFEQAKLDSSNILSYVRLSLNCGFLLDAFDIQYSFRGSVLLKDGSSVKLYDSGLNFVSNPYHLIDTVADIPVSEIQGFTFSCFYTEFIPYNSIFELTFDTSTYLGVTNENTFADNIIGSANNSVNDSLIKADGVIGELNELSPKPEINVSDIDTDGLSEIGKYLNTNNTVTTFFTTLAVSSLGVATIGYVLHGKRG